MKNPDASSFSALLAQAYRDHGLFLLATLSYAFLILILALAYHAPAAEIVQTMLAALGPIVSLLLALLIGTLIIAVYKSLRTPKQLFSEIEQQFAKAFSKKSLARHIAILSCIYPFFWAFLIQKSLIARIVPYNFDPLFSNIDHTLHGGHYPHELLPTLASGTAVISFLQQIYFIWFLIILAINAYAFFFDQNSARRKTYLWTNFIIWTFLGSLLAMMLSSAGPIFYGNFYPALPNPYTQINTDMLTAKTLGIDLWLTTITVLLDFHNNASVLDMNGITAMPSMHVAASVLACLYAFSINRLLGILAGIYTLLIIAASIILGFHYAIDGYFSVIATGILWFICKRLNSVS